MSRIALMPEKVHIRRLTEDDAQLVISSDAFDDPVIPDQAQAFLADDRHEIVAAIYVEQIIGFASAIVHLHPDKNPEFFISEVGVNKEYRRKGLGFRLVSHLLGLARERGCQCAWVSTEGDNLPARALYHKLNARETKEIVVYDWDEGLNR